VEAAPTLAKFSDTPKFGACRALTRVRKSCIFMHMRTTLIIDDALLERARKLSGIREKTALVHAGLDALIARESARRLAALGGMERSIDAPRRRRPKTSPDG
jgi:Arc/MetJ family transcription regulator